MNKFSETARELLKVRGGARGSGELAIFIENGRLSLNYDFDFVTCSEILGYR
jgi:hypothetical protein